ncbi:MAG: SgcJ/EcaC family oxidoreductase [Caldilineaceae bacterium]|nr:SgcJ/EcaC family oxidoreductase [Caldilineaceae bacterium]
MLGKQKTIGLLILAALLLSACQPIVAQPQAPATNEDVEAAVNAIWDEYEASVIAGDIDRWIAQWTEDGVQMPPNEPLVEGKENIYARVAANMAAGPTTDFVITPLETTSAGDWAYSRGVYTVTFPLGDSGEEGMIDGKFMTVLQRQPDGTWKIHRDIYNSNVPPAAAPETDVAQVTDAVNAIWREYEASVEAGDADRWGELWVDDGVKYPPDAPMLEGKEAIVNNMREWMAMATASEVTITNHTVEVAGDFAFVRGLFRVDAELRANGMPVIMDGKYMSILQRQPDGSWKLYRDIFNSNVPPAAAPETDVEAVIEAVNAIWDEYEASLLAGDADRWIAQWMEEGVQMPPNTLPRVGRDTIYAAVSGFLSQYEYTDFVIENEDVEVDGDLAFARGAYAATFAAKDGGDPVDIEGKYMTILRQQEDGCWKIYRDIFNSNVPPAAPEADIAALSAELHQRFSENDLEGAAEMADENIKMIGYGLGLDLEGREQFLKFMQARKRAFPDITVEHTNLVVQGDQVVVEFVATGTHTGPLMTPNGEIAATGKPVTLHVVEIHTWKDGKLVNLIQYQDPTSPLRQIGVLE